MAARLPPIEELDPALLEQALADPLWRLDNLYMVKTKEDEDGEGLVVRFRMNRAQQNMKCIIHHAEFGEVGRHAVNPNMLKGEVAA